MKGQRPKVWLRLKPQLAMEDLEVQVWLEFVGPCADVKVIQHKV